jgi:dihydropteroate synthase
MHWRGHSTVMQDRTAYTDVVTDVAAELRDRLDHARAAGIDEDCLVVDAGIGFAKTGDHNWQLLRRLGELATLNVPQLVGVSRKAFLGALLSDGDGRPRPPAQRDDATTALTTVLAERGVWGVRVHAVRASRDAIAVLQRLQQASSL